MNHTVSRPVKYAALFALGALFGTAQAAEERPNLLFIWTDDQRWDAIGYTNPFVPTPNLDRMAATGVRFDQAAIVLPVCSPSRATALTGRYAMAHGVTNYDNPIRPEETTLAEPLHAAGYTTAMIGKWHIEGKDPLDFAFSEVRNLQNTFYYWQPPVINNGIEEQVPGTGHDYVVDEAIKIMRGAVEAGRPFFIYLSTLEPHNVRFRHGGRERLREETRDYFRRNPLTALPIPPNIYDDLEGKPPYIHTYRGRRLRVGLENENPMTPERFRSYQFKIYSMMAELDHALGRLFEAMEEMGLMDDTYILMSSDNGLFDGEHGLMSKGLLYEEAVRVPLFLVGPGIEPGFDALSLPANIDFAPTLLDLAGLEIPAHMHGFSLKDVAKCRVPLNREYLLLEHPEENPTLEILPNFALRSREWKYIRTYENGVDEPHTFEELYNLLDDPFELTNLADDPEHARLLDRLRTLMHAQRVRFAE